MSILPFPGPGYVYFMQSGTDGPIKIGFTSGDPLVRIRGVQTGCPFPLRLIAAVEAPRTLEIRMHHDLQRFSTSGEWFEPAPPVMAAIAGVLKDYPNWIAPDEPGWRTSRHLTTAGDVIDALGGTGAVARMTSRGLSNVTNWRAAGRLAAATFLILTHELGLRGKTAPPALWGIEEPATAAIEPEQVRS